MNFLKILSSKKGRSKDPFELGEFYDLDRANSSSGEEAGFPELSPKELRRLKDTRDLWLVPARVADGLAIYRDGRFSSALEVGTVNFVLVSAEEQRRIIAGYHAVLLHLSSKCNLQIKVRMIDSDLEPLAERVDFALRKNLSPELHRLALNYKQFLRTLPKKRRLMERRNYLVISLRSDKIAQMADAFQQQTGRECTLYAGLGWKDDQQQRGLVAQSLPFQKPGHSHKKNKKLATVTPAEERREKILRTRQEQEMEQRIWDEMERTVTSLEYELKTIMDELVASGLSARRLPDWELLALFAEHLRPELADEARQAIRAKNLNTNLATSSRQAAIERLNASSSNWFSKAQPPLTLSEILGEQSETLVCTEQPALFVAATPSKGTNLVSANSAIATTHNSNRKTGTKR